MNEQLVITPPCKERGCHEPIVGHSITGVGHVCERHNEIEWGKSLQRSKWRDYQELGARLVAGAAA